MAVIKLNEQAMNLGTIFCVGRNYIEHVEELNNEKPDAPVIFCKPSNAYNTSNIFKMPKFSQEIHYETELVILIGKSGKNIAQKDANSYVAGFALGLDLTARDLQNKLKNKGLPWELSKGFDNAACVSDFVSADKFSDFNNIEFDMKLNGKLKQSGNTKMMMFTIAEQIAYLSQYFSLKKGDLIFTGTPKGIGKLNVGDQLDLSLSGAPLSYRVNIT